MSNGSKKPSNFQLLGIAAAVVLAIGGALSIYQPDRPVATIVPGSASSPAFVVQIIRPRLGLPLGGILPPKLFGQEAHLGFSSTSAGAAVKKVGPGRIELEADDWHLALAFDATGHVNPETEVVFTLVFEDQPRKVRCRPGEPATGKLNLTSPPGSAEMSGHFDIELPLCEDASTGQSLGWPPQPLVLHGSFDRLVSGAPARGD